MGIPTLQSDLAVDKSLPDRFLNFLTEKDIQVWDGKQYVASKALESLLAIEIKGTFEADWPFELPASPCFWLVFQFTGQSERDSKPHTALAGGEYAGFYSMVDTHEIRLKAKRNWMVLLGVQLADSTYFTAEWPLLEKPETADQPYFSKSNIAYRITQVFEKIRRFAATPYSLHSNIHSHCCQLIAIYHEDLNDKARSLHKEDIVIYHEAIEYIRKHYMDDDINRDTIAEKVGVNPRKLYRAFEGKHTTIHHAIQTIRLYRGREMLRETDMLVDGIAFQLHFSSAKYFYKQYVQLFGHSPSKERELHRKSKGKKAEARKI